MIESLARSVTSNNCRFRGWTVIPKRMPKLEQSLRMPMRLGLERRQHCSETVKQIWGRPMRARTPATIAGASLLVVSICGGVEAASVECNPRSRHAVCKANYAAHPAGTLNVGQRSTGTAVVKGKKVTWICLGGMMSGSMTVPRRCTY